MKEFLEPFWAFLFDKFGIFGFVIAMAIPVIVVVIVIVIVSAIVSALSRGGKSARSRRRRRSPASSRPKQDPQTLYEKAQALADRSLEDLPEAFNYYLRAARLGHVLAQYKAGRMYYYGFRSHAPDKEQGLYWLKKAAEGGSTGARIVLGRIYNGMRYQDPGICIDWLEEFAEENAEAQYLLSGLYSRKREWYEKQHGYGPGQWKNDPQCVQWYRKGHDWLKMAAENGNEDAMDLYY